MLQTLPQLPQFSGSVLRFFSQPLAYVLSQLAKPELHDATVHALAAQPAVPFATVQALPQLPQLFGLFEVFTSQPSLLCPLQSAKGAVQELMPQTALTQFAEAPPGVGQILPQTPQLFTLVLRLTSQPLATLPSQLANPALQAMPQLPPAHDGVPLLLLHTLPQPPQLPALVFTLTSQPLAGLPSQSAKPALQLAMSQTPATQLEVPLAATHSFPQVPQLLGSVFLLTSQPSPGRPLQSRLGLMQLESLQALFAQEPRPPGKMHCLPHTPQFWSSDCTLASQPVAAVLSQSPKPAEQLAIVHAPAMQDSLAFRRSHTAPQAPQLFTFVCRSTSQPSVLFELQSANPALHAPAPHTPVLHSATAPAGAGQLLAQLPQLLGSLLRVDSQPSLASELQSPRPALQDPTPHFPSVHLPVALVGAQAAPQLPQLSVLVWVFVHTVSQQSKPLGHFEVAEQPGMQVLPVTLHTVPGGQSESCPQPTHRFFVVSQVNAPPSVALPPPTPVSPMAICPSSAASEAEPAPAAPPLPAAPPDPLVPPVPPDPVAGLQSSSSLHPTLHVEPAQYVPVGHLSLLGEHSTQVEVGASHTGVLGVDLQSASALHPPASAASDPESPAAPASPPSSTPPVPPAPSPPESFGLSSKPLNSGTPHEATTTVPSAAITMPRSTRFKLSHTEPSLPCAPLPLPIPCGARCMSAGR